jgi:GT2 family glycosyltransferase
LVTHDSHWGNIAVLITCHNRREKTLGCLQALQENSLRDGVRVVVYLVDDASTDGTRESVKTRFPDTIILEGDGSLYWNKGTWRAFDVAMRTGHDFYLWLNDDLFLYPDALETMLTTYGGLAESGHPLAIVVGSTEDPGGGNVTYGGQIHASKWHPLKLRRVEPGSMPKPCHTMNGNCVLIPSRVAELVGNLDPIFSHAMGDTDYGFRARRRGCELWVAPGFVGALSRNPSQGSWTDRNLRFTERWRKATGPKGLPPRDWRILLMRVAGPLWPLFWVTPYAKLILQSLIPRRGH